MSGPKSVTVENNRALTLNDFRQLTVNRDVNKGTLIVRKDANQKVVGLECACHHDFFKSWNKPELITDTTREDLRKAFEDVVNSELETIGNRLKNSPTGVVSDALKGRIDSRIAALKGVFQSKIDSAVEKSELKSLPRKDIGNFIVALDELNRFTVEDVETLSEDEMRAFVSGSWKVGEFSLAKLDRVPSDTDTLNGISAAIQTFVRKAIPGVGNYANILKNAGTIQKLINKLTVENYGWAYGNDDADDWEREYNDWATSLRENLAHTLPIDIEGKLKPLFERAFKACAEGRNIDAEKDFGKMVDILSGLAQKILGQCETKAHVFGTVTERYGLAVEMEATMTVIMKLVADHGLKIDRNSVWGLFARLEHQDKDGWKMFKDLGCNRLDTFIAYRQLTKNVQELLKKAAEEKPVEKKNADKPESATTKSKVEWRMPADWRKEVEETAVESQPEELPVDEPPVEEKHDEGNEAELDHEIKELIGLAKPRTEGNRDQVTWSSSLANGRWNQASVEEKPIAEKPVENHSVEKDPDADCPLSAFGGDLKLKYAWTELGKSGTDGDAFDGSKPLAERNKALSESVRTACKGKHFRKAVCHVLNEIALRHRQLAAADETSFRNDYWIRDYLQFLRQFAEDFEDDSSKTVGEFCEKIRDTFKLATQRLWISDVRFAEDIVNAFDLLVAMYGDQEKLRKVDEKSLKAFLAQ